MKMGKFQQKNPENLKMRKHFQEIPEENCTSFEPKNPFSIIRITILNACFELNSQPLVPAVFSHSTTLSFPP